MSTEPLGKVLDFLGKYSWAVFVMAAFVLFIPQDAADQIGIYTLRANYKGLWWLLLVLSGAVWIGVAFRYLNSRIFDGWLARRAERRKRKAEQHEMTQALDLRLKSLDENETTWIIYCLFHNIQTLSAVR